MVNFAVGRNLAVTGIWYQYHDIHKVTWTSPDNKACNQINHMLVNGRHCMNECVVRSVRGTEIESDHFLVTAKIRVKIKGSEKTKKSEIEK
jgi:endonuclease/exonuclease/phosphatase family metal-dependent hydrolase